MSTLLYNPDKKNKQQFLEEFVVRTSVFDDILKDIQTGKMKHPEQHYLIVGQRGSGKTTLLNRLKYAIEDDAKLKTWLIPVLFNEEQYHIIELANIWENVASYLEDFHGFKGIMQEIEKQISHKDFEQLALDILLKHLNKHQKKIVLFIDNVGDLLKKFDTLEVRRLREILQTIPEIRLIAGSPVMLESILDYQQPLFEFFKVIQLKGLSSEETIQLLKKLAEINHESKRIDTIIKKTPSRIETLRTLSGGVPRTIALLFMVFIDDEHGNAVSDLEKVLDLVTPLYKHRMDDLPTQQQKIVDAVAKNWDAVSVKELSETLRMESKVISAQLRQLEKNQVIEKRTTNTKNHIYLLRERFFNIWYLMRYGRKQDRQRVIWLVKFLEMWCDEKEIEKRILNYAEKTKNGLLDERTIELYGEVYSFFNKIKPETKMILKEAAPKYISQAIELTNKDFDDLINEVSEKKGWEKILDITKQIKKLSSEQKSKLFNLWLKNDQFRDITHTYVDSVFDQQAEDEDIPNVFFVYLFCNLIIRLPIEKGQKDFPKIVKEFGNVYNILLKQDSISGFENDLIFDIAIELLILESYKNALVLFKQIFKEENIKDRTLEVLFVACKYFESNEDKSTLNNYGLEFQEIVLKVVKLIKEQSIKRNEKRPTK